MNSSHFQKWRQHGTQAFTALGQTDRFKLQRGSLVRGYTIRLRGTVSLAAAKNLKALWNRGDELSLIKNIKIVANANDVLREMSGYELAMLNFYFNRAMRHRLSPIVGSGVVLATTDDHHFDVMLDMPFYDPFPGVWKPMDTVLDTTRLSEVSCEVTWADAYRAVAGDGTNVTAIVATATIYGWESDALGGEYASGSGNFFPTRWITRTYSHAGAVIDQEQEFPKGPSYRGFLINASTTANSQQTDKPDIFTGNLKLTRGTEVILDLPWNVLHYMGLRSVGANGGPLWNDALTPPTAVAGANVEHAPVNTVGDGSAETVVNTFSDQGNHARPFNSELSDLRATTLINTMADGMFSEAIGTAGYPDLKIKYSTTGAADIRIIPLEVYPPEKA